MTQKWSTLSVCAFLQGILWCYPHVLHSFNLTSFEAKTVEIPHLLHNFEAKSVVLPRFLQSFKAKAVVSPHFSIFHTVWSQNCDMSTFFAYLCSHELILPHVLHSLKPKTAIWPHVLHSFRAKTVILPPVFHSLEIKTMMFLHLLCSFGSKTVKLPHVWAFFFNFA